MSAITIENDLVHYEVLGRGRPVILIHGWLGSWRYWIPTMQQLSLKYRIYALDLWGFGDTQKDTKRYGFKSQVTLLYEFMDKMLWSVMRWVRPLRSTLRAHIQSERRASCWSARRFSIT